MTKLLAYPFSVTPGGRIATVEHDSDEAAGQQLQVLIATRLGERPLVPTFGVPDPAFRGLTVDDVRSAVELFGPPVEIVDVTAGPVVGALQEVQVTFNR